MKVLVKNIRHLNESVFQGMFDKAFSSYAKKKQINESDPNPYSFNNTMRNNLATYLNYGVFVGSAISNDSNVVPVPTQDETRKRLPYPYVPIMGYGIKALEDTPGTSTTAIRKSGIGEDEELKEAFSNASSIHPEIIQPDGIIFGWQQKLDGKNREHKKGTSLSIDRKSSWGRVGKALAFQQICYLNDDGELAFSDNPSEIYPIYSTQKQHGTNAVCVKLVPLGKQSFLQAIGNEFDEIISSKIGNIVSIIMTQSNDFNMTNKSSALKFLTNNPIAPTLKIDNEYKPIPSKMYRKVFDLLVKYLIDKIPNETLKEKISSEFSYIVSYIENGTPIKSTIDDVFNLINDDSDNFIKKMSSTNGRLPDTEYISKLKTKRLTKDEKNILKDRLEKAFNEKYGKDGTVRKNIPYKGTIKNILKSVGSDDDTENDIYNTNLDNKKIKTIF